MSVVIDNSMALAWTLPDEGGAVAETVLDQVIQQGGHVPYIFRAEFANALTMAVRRGRIDRQARGEALVFMETLQLVHDMTGIERTRSAVDIADLHNLTVYDAIYLDLAARIRLPLATLDKKLANAARAANVPLAVPQV